MVAVKEPKHFWGWGAWERCSPASPAQALSCYSKLCLTSAWLAAAGPCPGFCCLGFLLFWLSAQAGREELS